MQDKYIFDFINISLNQLFQRFNISTVFQMKFLNNSKQIEIIIRDQMYLVKMVNDAKSGITLINDYIKVITKDVYEKHF